jgi:hypothetical protein
MKYSKWIEGSENNHGWPARFDKDRGCVGISQTAEDGSSIITDRVLLSPKQVRELLAFLGAEKKPRRKKVSK